MKKKILVIVIIVVLSFYLYLENTELVVSKFYISDSEISNDFNNYKIIQISDFHNTRSKKLVDNIVKEIEKQKPNIIVLTGDFIDSRKTDISGAIKFIKKINSIASIYFITGNHESKSEEYLKLRDELLKNKVIILDNMVEILSVNDSKINLIGINDPRMGNGSSRLDVKRADDELKKIEYDCDNYSILLSHRSEIFDIYVDNDIDLVLTGHAHGGQVIIPFVGGVIAPNQGWFPKYTNGIYVKDKTTMIVSRGIGNSIIPFRINNRPELVVIELSNKL